jgi:hypothetical protein
MTTARTLDPSFSCSDWNLAEHARDDDPGFDPRGAARDADPSDSLAILRSERLDPYDADWLE